MTLSLALSAACLVPARAEVPAEQAAFFQQKIQPLLEKNCYKCHSHEANKSRGGLMLDSASGWLTGGNSGPALVPGNPDKSLLIQAVRWSDENLHMPPKQKLPDADVALIEQWVKMGAPDPRAKDTSVRTPSGLDWWSLQALERPALPGVDPQQAGWARTPIDSFILAKLREKKLAPSSEADQRTLIRRLTFDLHGLPPPPEEVEAFAHDRAADAYEKLVDRLLASPRYGERWARHWLDVAHYGESNGFGMDRPRLNAWPYRDYVIAAFNRDLPYARFVQEQIAADVLFPDESALIPALGFMAAGPFNQSALSEQVDGTDCKRIALNLERDDMASSVSATFLSMTVHCARCHEHKFDPIGQRDYYRLQAVFAGVGRVDRIYDLDPKSNARRRLLLQKKSALEKDPHAVPLAPEEEAELAADREKWERPFAGELARWHVLEIVAAKSQEGTTFTHLPDGSLLAGGPKPDRDTYTLKTKLDLAGVTALRLEVLPHDSLPKNGPGRQDNGNMYLSEFRVVAELADAAGKPAPLTLQNPTADFSQTDRKVAFAVDGKADTAWGIVPEIGKRHEAVFELKEPVKNSAALTFTLEQVRGNSNLIGRLRLSATATPLPARALKLPGDIVAILAVAPAQRTPAQTARLARHHRLIFINQKLAALPAPRKVFAISHDFAAQKNYKPPREPYPIYILRRGDIKQPLQPVGPGALSCVSTLRPDFELHNPKDEGARRAALAKWVTDPANMLTWRSIVNRVWHYHFGRGLVDSPNDFGRMGSTPTHPELLDWLAVDFRDGGGSIKALHRLIVTSAVYRQRSDHDPGRAALDSDNRYLWRMNRARLDAESLRDTLLAVSGKLDLTMGGPAVMQFRYHDPNKEVMAQIDYDKFDPDVPASRRRGVYRFLFRNVNDPLLEAFDVVDPSLSTPKRNVTTTPLQALSLYNNRFVLRQCEHLAARLEREASEPAARIDRAFRLALSRSPRPEEADLLVGYAREHGLANACRVLVNCNDFLFVH